MRPSRTIAAVDSALSTIFCAVAAFSLVEPAMASGPVSTSTPCWASAASGAAGLLLTSTVSAPAEPGGPQRARDVRRAAAGGDPHRDVGRGHRAGVPGAECLVVLGALDGGAQRVLAARLVGDEDPGLQAEGRDDLRRVHRRPSAPRSRRRNSAPGRPP